MSPTYRVPKQQLYPADKALRRYNSTPNLGRRLGLNLSVLLPLASSMRTRVLLTKAVEQVYETDFPVNLIHPLDVGGRGALAAKDNVHLLERETLRFGEEEPDERRTHAGQDAEEDVRAVADAWDVTC